MTEEQNEVQEQVQEQNDEVNLLQEQLKQLQMELEIATKASSPVGILQVTSPDKLPQDTGLLSEVIKRHLDSHLPKDERHRVLGGFNAMAKTYEIDIAYIAKNIAAYRALENNQTWTTGEHIFIDEFQKHVQGIRSFAMRVPKNLGFKPLVNPDQLKLPAELIKRNSF